MRNKTAEDLYEHVVRRMPVKERLRLAGLIVNDVALASVEEGHAWTEEDEQELRRASLAHVAQGGQDG